MSPQIEITQEEKLLIRACHDHARSLLQAAETILVQDHLPNIAYHLATLALEETGKAGLIAMRSVARRRSETPSWLERHGRHHVKKLFHAIWATSFGREVIDKKQIQAYQDLAQRIHQTRLRGLYVDMDDDLSLLPQDAVSAQQAQKLIEFARARLEFEPKNLRSYLEPSEEENLTWFFQAADDAETKDFIFGQASMEQLAKLANVRDWIAWLKKQTEKAEARAKELLEKEFNRKPLGGAQHPNKWSVKIRLHSASHSIRAKPLNWWNSIADWIKLYPIQAKTKQLNVEFRFSEEVNVKNLWSAGYAAAQRFLTALNIGSMGFFWWHLPEHISRYYEKARDIEHDHEVRLEMKPELTIDWPAGTLQEDDLRKVAVCFGRLPPGGEPWRPFAHYLLGLGFLAKTDLRLRFEANAFEQLFVALEGATRALGSWGGAALFEDIWKDLMVQMLPEADAADRYLELGLALIRKPAEPPQVTLSDVGVMKMLCDGYFMRKLAELQRQEPDAE